jgi:predicted nucleic acid-binding protein
MEALNVFLDSNVLFSLCWKGPEGTLLGVLLELREYGRIRLLVSPLVLDETAANLAAKRPEALSRLGQIAATLSLVPDAQVPLDCDLPENDRIILSSAVACGADFFLTGNKTDFAGLYGKAVKGTRVVEPRTFLHRRR